MIKDPDFEGNTLKFFRPPIIGCFSIILPHSGPKGWWLFSMRVLTQWQIRPFFCPLSEQPLFYRPLFKGGFWLFMKITQGQLEKTSSLKELCEEFVKKLLNGLIKISKSDTIYLSSPQLYKWQMTGNLLTIAWALLNNPIQSAFYRRIGSIHQPWVLLVLFTAARQESRGKTRRRLMRWLKLNWSKNLGSSRSFFLALENAASQLYWSK